MYLEDVWRVSDGVWIASVRVHHPQVGSGGPGDGARKHDLAAIGGVAPVDIVLPRRPTGEYADAGAVGADGEHLRVGQVGVGGGYEPASIRRPVTVEGVEPKRCQTMKMAAVCTHQVDGGCGCLREGGKDDPATVGRVLGNLLVDGAVGDAVNVAPVRAHRVDVEGRVPGGTVGEHDPAAVWRPGWLPGESLHVGDLVDVAAVGIHGVHLPRPGAVAVEDDFTPVRRPSGPEREVLRRRVRELIAVTAVRIDAGDLGAAT